jgi:L-arabinonolactonase
MVKLLVDARARLGECVLWCERDEALYWTDIEASTLYRHRPGDGEHQHWKLPERLGSFALCEESGMLLLGLASGVAPFDLATGKLGPIVQVEAEHPATRINDGRCDAQGRFVFGMFQPGPGRVEGSGHFYRIGADLMLERLPLPPAVVANSITFSPDGARIYFADSPARTIWCAEYHADGRIGKPREFVRYSKGEGYPDGSAIDAGGGLWNAAWDGGCLTRHDPNGKRTHRIELPAARPTCPAFGGAGFERLYVSTARIGLSEEALAAQPAAGGIFELTVPGVRGLPERRFATRQRLR